MEAHLSAQDARLKLRVTPRAGRDAIEGWDGDTLRVRVRAAPADGKANDAVLRLLAKALDVAPSRLTLVSGAQSRTKLIAVEGVSDVRQQIEARRKGG